MVQPAHPAAADLWVACFGGARDVRADRVDCPLVSRSVSLATCLECRHLLAVAEEREGWTACAIGERR